MEKEKYEKPLFELITFLDVNIITTSPEEGDVPEEDEDENDLVSMAKSLVKNLLKPWVEDEEGNMWLTDEEGNILLDEEGNPIAYTPEVDGSTEGQENPEQPFVPEGSPEPTTTPEEGQENVPSTPTPEDITDSTPDANSQLTDALNELFGGTASSSDVDAGGGGNFEQPVEDVPASPQPDSGGNEGAGW